MDQLPLLIIILSRKSMLDKYQCFYKLSKSPQCSVFTAFNRVTAQHVLILNIKTPLLWNQILTHKHLPLISKTKIFPKLQQIFRHKGAFFFVFEKPYGNSLSLSSPVQKQTIPTVIQLISDLLEGLLQLQAAVPNVSVILEWVYFHRNSLKIIHYQPFLNYEKDQKNHIATHIDSFGQSSEWMEEGGQTDFVPEEYKKSIVLHLGILIYRLITGKKEENIKSKEEYRAYVQNIREHCERQINRQTEDTRIASFVFKMLSTNRFQMPTLNQVYNFFQYRGRLLRSKKVNKQHCLEVQLQRISIPKGKSSFKHKQKQRNCCFKQQHLKTVGDQLREIGLTSQRQIDTAKKSSLLLPYLSIKNSYTLPRNKNLSCINRHKPILTTPHSIVSNREQIRSFDYIKTQSQT